MGYFCHIKDYINKNHIKFELQKYKRVISYGTEEWCKV